MGESPADLAALDAGTLRKLFSSALREIEILRQEIETQRQEIETQRQEVETQRQEVDKLFEENVWQHHRAWPAARRQRHPQ